MKYYADFISSDTKVKYIQSNDYQGIYKIFESLKENEVHCYLTDDYLLERRINRYAKKHQVPLVRYTNPNFLNPENEVRDMLSKKKNYFMANFYAESRKKHGILLEKGDKPLGGKWSFDADNRKKVPKSTVIPKVKTPNLSNYIDEAKEYVEDQFANNYGNVDQFYYAITHTDAEEHLQHFINERLTLFGDYEDAMVADERWLWHSVLTPMLNVGLLSPKQVIHEVLTAHQTQHFPLNSLEGFIRQILGWREFIRGIYSLEGVKQRTTNHFGYSRKIPESFWTGDTGIVPLDQTIKKLLKTGYSHHIERLMLFGNFMMLCEFDPDEVHRWFMEMYVDAYDWVMAPNVMGMGLFSDRGSFATKPYICGSSYILKMSDYPKGEWCEVMDGLYWKFIQDHKDFFLKNYRLAMMAKLLEKMDSVRKKRIFSKADEFIHQNTN